MSRFALLVPCLLLVAPLDAAPNARIPAIQSVKNVRPLPTVVQNRFPAKPLVLKSAKDAARYFDKGQLDRLKQQVDFQKQTVVVFAWQGSGRDRFVYHIAESNPEQIHFDYKRGLTDDLKQHIHVFALRSNVTWRVRFLR